MDGTKEFINGSTEFSICIALMENNQPVFGLVSAPSEQSYWWGGVEIAATKRQNNSDKLITTQPAANPVTIITSRRHGIKSLQHFEDYVTKTWPQVQHKKLGSALKMCAIAEGLADIYPRLGPTCEWDTAAAQAVLHAAGGCIIREDLQPLLYNKENLLNPSFFAIGDTLECWQATLTDFVAKPQS